MKLYIVIWEDQQVNTTVYPFTDPEKAIAEAQRVAKENEWEEGDYQERDYGRDEGWLFYAAYSPEGDHTRVVTCELDEGI